MGDCSEREEGGGNTKGGNSSHECDPVEELRRERRQLVYSVPGPRVSRVDDGRESGLYYRCRGEVSEWFMDLVLKTSR